MVTKEELKDIIDKYNRGEDTGYTDEDEEEWVDINYPGIMKNTYRISNHGNVSKDGVLKPSYIGNNGYKAIRLKSSKNHKTKLCTIHRLVAYHFVNGHSKIKKCR